MLILIKTELMHVFILIIKVCTTYDVTNNAM